MNYDEVTAGWASTPMPTEQPGPTVGASPARQLRDAIEPIAMHSVWSRSTHEQLAALGLDFISSYVWSRASALGIPDPGVVVSTFAVFEPDYLRRLYTTSSAIVDRDTLIATRTEATIASLGQILDGIDVAPVADLLQEAVSAADVTARPLFAGFLSQPWPDDPIGRLWRATELAREYRGDSHNAVCVAQGLGPVAMNVLTELWVGMPLGSYTATRGWSDEAIARTVAELETTGLVREGSLTPAGQQFRDQIEARTDAMGRSIVDAIGEDFESVVQQLDAWSALCVEAHAFPPNALKRAAG
ncbi:MAG: hypothetical protein ACI8TP_002590 [Acidimicrobiales bacterium]|jgi:hypothetical protein